MIRYAKFVFLGSIFATVVLMACDDDNVPAEGNDEEFITKVELIFSPVSGGNPIVITAEDPDGEGPKGLSSASDIMLSAGDDYELFVGFENIINGEDITKEVEEEADEYMIFFGFSEGVFKSPSGTGNIQGPGGVNYVDKDENNLPIGLVTSWIAGDAGKSGTFRLVLKHQPNTKSMNTTVADGVSAVDVTWGISIQ